MIKNHLEQPQEYSLKNSQRNPSRMVSRWVCDAVQIDTSLNYDWHMTYTIVEKLLSLFFFRDIEIHIHTPSIFSFQNFFAQSSINWYIGSQEIIKKLVIKWQSVKKKFCLVSLNAYVDKKSCIIVLILPANERVSGFLTII
jgi:hypothetical protein